MVHIYFVLMQYRSPVQITVVGSQLQGYRNCSCFILMKCRGIHYTVLIPMLVYKMQEVRYRLNITSHSLAYSPLYPRLLAILFTHVLALFASIVEKVMHLRIKYSRVLPFTRLKTQPENRSTKSGASALDTSLESVLKNSVF